MKRLLWEAISDRPLWPWVVALALALAWIFANVKPTESF